jgi:hypothetical protein
MKGKYLRLFPLTSFSNFHKRYLEMVTKKKVCKEKVENNWLEGGWIFIEKYFRG